MKALGRAATLGALIEVACWVIATTLRPGAWRYDISALYAAGSPHPWLVMAGESALGVALAALALGLRQFMPRSDHRMIGCAMLAAASAGEFAGGLARDSCEESVPACAGHAYTTPTDWIEAIGSFLVVWASPERRWCWPRSCPGDGQVLHRDRLRGPGQHPGLADRPLPVDRHRRARPGPRARGMGRWHGRTHRLRDPAPDTLSTNAAQGCPPTTRRAPPGRKRVGLGSHTVDLRQSRRDRGRRALVHDCREGASLVWRPASEAVDWPQEASMSQTRLMPFQPEQMNPGQLDAVSYLARYSGHTHTLYAASLAAGSAGARSTDSTPWSGSNGLTSSWISVTSASPG